MQALDNHNYNVEGAEGENILHLGDIGENFAEAVFTKGAASKPIF